MAAIFQHKRSSGFRRRKFVKPRRRRGVWLSVLRSAMLALLMVSVPVTAGVWFCSSEQFHLREVVAEGTERVPADWVEEVVGRYAGRHLLWLSLPEVENRLRRHAWVAAVEVRKELPSSLLVRIEERQPVALLRRDDELIYLDGDGSAFAPFIAGGGPADLVLISAADESRESLRYALALIERLRAVEPAWSAGLSEVEVLNRRDIRLHTEVVPFPVLLTDRGFEAGVKNLRRYLPEIRREFPGVGSVDLRFAKQMVVKPAAEPRSQKG